MTTSEQAANFALPLRRARLQGTLVLYQKSHGCAPVLGLQEAGTEHNLIWPLKDGDVVQTPTGDVPVKHRMVKASYLNNRIGTLFRFTPCAHFSIEKRRLDMMPNVKTAFFLGCCPVMDKEDLCLLLDACFFERSVILAPAAQPLAQQSPGFCSGHLRAHYEAGAEAVAIAVETRDPIQDEAWYYIRPGDRLNILDATGTSTLWTGTLTPELLDNLRETFKAPGLRTPGYEDIPAEVFLLNEFITKNCPAVLKKARVRP